MQTTLIHGDHILIHCITYKQGKNNQVIGPNGIQWECLGSGKFKIPLELMCGDEISFGISDGVNFNGRLMRIVSIDKKRIRWEELKRLGHSIAEKNKTSDERKKILGTRAIGLRRKSPDSEVWFRSILKDSGFDDVEWNYPVLGKFILDFAWPKQMVAVEIDEPYHGEISQKIRDEKRDQVLRLSGWRVFRINFPDYAGLDETLKEINRLVFEDRQKRIERKCIDIRIHA